ncbi:MAG TPA: Rieske 2Fe-2S domain-containing protein [Thermomicrobiales bacterium]|nr:Rieske 2Fe-2S domain-containing protein [Thermomicrobiales bacterium]
MKPLFRTVAGLALGSFATRLIALLGRFHSSPNGVHRRTSRRTFTRNAALGAVGIVTAEIAAGFAVFFWPNKTGAFGSEIAVAADQIPEVGGVPFRHAPGKFFVVHAEEGLLAMYTKCPHLGCTVPYLQGADPPFQCPCHGSHYNYVGERVAGPAPRPMDWMPISIDETGTVFVNTGDIRQREEFDPSQATPIQV